MMTFLTGIPIESIKKKKNEICKKVVENYRTKKIVAVEIKKRMEKRVEYRSFGRKDRKEERKKGR